MSYIDSNILPNIFTLSLKQKHYYLRKQPMIPLRKFRILINRMMKQGSKKIRLPSTLNNLFCCHFEVFRKYNDTSLKFVELFLN